MIAFVLANIEWIGGIAAAGLALLYRYTTRRNAVKEDRRAQAVETTRRIDKGAATRDRSDDARDKRMRDRGLS